MKITHLPRNWQHINAPLRFLMTVLAGIGAFLLLPDESSLAIHLALSWSIAGSVYLVLSYVMMYFSTEENILSLSKKEDDGAAMIFLIIVFTASASLVTIVMILSGIKSLPTHIAIRHVALVLVTYIVSWLSVHTAFALHYTYLYYQEYEKNKEAPLLFASKLTPTYVDFLYFSMVIGMTCQTADVNIASSRLRFSVMIQGMTAFAFNASLLALAINLISGVVSFA